MEPLISILPARTCTDMAKTAGGFCTVEQMPQDTLPETPDFGLTLEEKMVTFDATVSSIPGISDAEDTSCQFPDEPSEEIDMPLPEQTLPLEENRRTEVTEVTEKTVLPQLPEQVKTLLVNAYGTPAVPKREIPSEELRIINETVAALEGSSPRAKAVEPEGNLKETPAPSAKPEKKESEGSEQPQVSPYGTNHSSEVPLKDPSFSNTIRDEKTPAISKEKGPEQNQPFSFEKKTKKELMPEKELPAPEKSLPREGPVMERTALSEEKVPETEKKNAPLKTSVSELPPGGMENLQGKASPAASGLDSIALQTSGDRAIGEGLAHVVSLLKNEKGEKKGILRVEPPELGKVRIVVNSSSDEIHVHLTVEKPEAGDLIKGSEDVLRDSLKRQGLALGDLSVDVGNNGEREHFTGRQKYDLHSHESAEPDLAETEEDSAVLARIDLEQGILHWIA